VRPPHNCSDTAWTDYLFIRDNPSGVHLERWCHTHGCARWFNMARNTVTHQILSVYSMLDGKPTTHIAQNVGPLVIRD
jgi:heterotetrameric sarcosine oxidase delta subunit